MQDSGTEVQSSSKGLRAGALGLPGGLAIGVASATPASSLLLVVIVPGAAGLVVLALIPVIMLGSAFYYLNRADPDCGQTFSWSSRAFGPQVGWIVGFLVAVAAVIGLSSLAQTAAQYVLLGLGLQRAVASTFWPVALGICWLVAVVALVAIGIRATVRALYVLLGIQLVVLLVFALGAIVKAALIHPTGYTVIGSGQLLPVISVSPRSSRQSGWPTCSAGMP